MSLSLARQDVAVRRWSDIADPERLLAQIDAIFFEASATKAFADEETARAFRERWLGRYLAHDPQWAYLALAADGTVAGYLVGSLDDPAKTPRFSDIAYFRDFAGLTSDYPAHFHVNLAPEYRGHGVGAALVEAFAADAARAGARGMHVVTGAGMRNIAFYERNGFRELGRASANGREVVFLARSLA
jgi:GNAT superfamily N-acetyltransferase